MERGWLAGAWAGGHGSEDPRAPPPRPAAPPGCREAEPGGLSLHSLGRPHVPRASGLGPWEGLCGRGTRMAASLSLWWEGKCFSIASGRPQPWARFLIFPTTRERE